MQIRLLESQQGLVPDKGRSFLAKKQTEKIVRQLDAAGVSVKAKLHELKRKKVELCLKRQREEINRQVKKAKAFALRKLIKRIKEERAKSPESQRLKGLEERLASLKAVKHQEEALLVFDNLLLLASECARKMLEEFNLLPAGELRPSNKMIEGKSLQAAIHAVRENVETFSTNLLRDNPAQVAVSARKAHNLSGFGAEPDAGASANSGADPDANPDADTGTGNDFFVDNLNAPARAKGGKKNGTDYYKEEPAVRKNRMGQKARRALWEQQYGQKANHILRQREQKDAGHSARSGGSGRERTVKRNLPKMKADPELHPSWIARQEAKAKERDAHFQGQKTTFGDSD